MIDPEKDTTAELERLTALVERAARYVCHNVFSSNRTPENFRGPAWKEYPSDARCWDINTANDWWCAPCVCKRALMDKDFNIDHLDSESHYPDDPPPKKRRGGDIMTIDECRDNLREACRRLQEAEEKDPYSFKVFILQKECLQLLELQKAYLKGEIAGLERCLNDPV